MKQTLCEWVLVVRNSAYHTYQVLEGPCKPRRCKSKWLIAALALTDRIVVAAQVGIAIYGMC